MQEKNCLLKATMREKKRPCQREAGLFHHKQRLHIHTTNANVWESLRFTAMLLGHSSVEGQISVCEVVHMASA